MKIKLAAEFEMIENYFKPLAGQAALGLSDDAAVLNCDNKYELVMTTDAMVSGVHFFPDDSGYLVAKKLLRSNLSDLAAMGAQPLGYLMTLSLPENCFKKFWFESFVKGLKEDQEEFGFSLFGGDTTRNSVQQVFSLTMIGKVEKGKALRRNNAKPGDGLWVTGTLGDSALGLLVLQGKIKDEYKELVDRYHIPQPRINLFANDFASAGLDISDGFIQDLGHLSRQSQVGAYIEVDRIPFSRQALKLKHDYLETCLTGGDDYELLLSIPPMFEEKALISSERSGIPLTKIGWCTKEPEVVIFKDHFGNSLHFEKTGWSHI
ncbi:Thiamine-monophosphate kinase [Commensalibacter sp. Nvir]|uniref:thiamine-phosphate kinase n=1 Tax=Commensalibacter sp. Nvir TaxID=3069817 RepID=UPI002D6DB800|nr:Thiamine-monophosphate kinase [Commensalibacter sp. Nvir]